MSTRFYGKLQPLKGLSIEGSFNYVLRDRLRYQQPVFNDRWNFFTNRIAREGTGRTSVTNQNDKNFQYSLDGIALYVRTFMDRVRLNVLVVPSRNKYKKK